MSVVELLVDVMGPVVLIVGLGWITGRRFDFDVLTLARLAFWVLGAAFVLDIFTKVELDGTTVVRVVVAAHGAMLAGGLVARTSALARQG